MEFLVSIFEWIGTNESVLSGVAATIVILSVLYIPIRTLVRRWAGSTGVEPCVSWIPMGIQSKGNAPAVPTGTHRD